MTDSSAKRLRTDLPMDADIWRKVPGDVFLSILKHTDGSTVTRAACASKSYRILVEAELQRRATVIRGWMKDLKALKHPQTPSNRFLVRHGALWKSAENPHSFSIADEEMRNSVIGNQREHVPLKLSWYLCACIASMRNLHDIRSVDLSCTTIGLHVSRLWMLSVGLQRLRIEVLRLRNIGLEDSGARNVAEMIRYHRPTLHTLVLSDNKIGYVGMRHISLSIAECVALRFLDVSRNVLRDEGTEALLSALENHGLSTLMMEWNVITATGFRHIGRAFARMSLRHISVFGNYPRDEGLQALADGIAANPTILQTLRIGNDIGKSGMQSTHLGVSLLCRIIPEMTHLEELMMSTMNVFSSDDGCIVARAFGKAVAGLPRLHTLDLDKTGMTDDSVCAFIDGMEKRRPPLTRLSLSQNKFGIKAAIYLLTNLKCPTAKLVDVGYANYTQTQWCKLLQTAKRVGYTLQSHSY